MKIMKSKTKPIDQQLKSALAAQIAENRRKLHPIVKTVIFCGRQNISLRGHREDEQSRIPGNFKTLLKFRVESGDEVLQEHLSTAQKNAQYTSKDIQNEIICVIGCYIQSKIRTEIDNGSNVS